MFNLQIRRECSKSYFDNGIKNTIFKKVITYKRTREYAASVDSYRTAFTIPIFLYNRKYESDFHLRLGRGRRARMTLLWQHRLLSYDCQISNISSY